MTTTTWTPQPLPDAPVKTTAEVWHIGPSGVRLIALTDDPETKAHYAETGYTVIEAGK